MTAKQKRVLRRAMKGLLATLVAQAIYVLQEHIILTMDNAWQYLLVPALVTGLLALEKGLQPEEKPKSKQIGGE